jgi:trehalose/maltose transport system substrate-binding protein
MRRTTATSIVAVMLAGATGLAADAAELQIAAGDTGDALLLLREHLDRFEQATGHTVAIIEMPSSSTDQLAQYRVWLADRRADLDVLFIDVIWSGLLAGHLHDLTDAAAEIIDRHLPEIVASQTVDGRLVAIPYYTDAPALYYRTDLLEQHEKTPPETWGELEVTAREIMAAEHAAGNTGLWGFVFQGALYEGLTCNALEWVASNDGGTFIDAEGRVVAVNDHAIRALDRAAGWVGTIAPPGVIGYREEESRVFWQTGNAVFMRNWPYAYALGNAESSPIAGRFDVVPLPRGAMGTASAATLGGWNAAVSAYSAEPEAATELALFLTSEDIQKDRAIRYSFLPTIAALYDDPEIAEAQPLIPAWREVVENAVPRPSAPTGIHYSQVSQEIWTAAHNTIAGRGDAATNLTELERRLRFIGARGW